MPKSFQSWTVLPHKPIEKLSENLWTVEGKMPDGKAQRRMVIAKLGDGRLIIHNGIALEEHEMRDLDEFGRVAAIIVPSGFHRLDAFIWKQRYPDAKVYCPRGSMKRVKQVVAVDGDLSAVPGDANVRTVHLDGLKDFEGFMEIKSSDGATLVFNDAVLNMIKLGGVSGVLLHPTGRPSVPRVMKWMAVKNRRAFHNHLMLLADTPGLKRIAVGHGKTITENPREALKSVARELGD